jgi:hypothetical protein
MSKKNRLKIRNRDNSFSTSSSPSPAHIPANSNGQHAAEYKIITQDMIRLIVLNGIMLAAVLAVYFTNRSSGYLERIYSQIF